MGIETRISIGSAQFGSTYGISNKHGQTLPQEVAKILDFAVINGINSLDTAAAYGNAEEELGKHNLRDFEIISKFMPTKKGEKLETKFKNSLKHLKVSKLHGLLAHRPLQLLENLHLWQEMQEFKSNGLVDKIGFSLNEPSELEILLEHGLCPDIIQAPFNYFDRRFISIFFNIKDLGCEIHARSSFLQGLFFTDMDNLSDFFDEIKPVIRSLQESVTFLAGSLLRFALDQTCIDKVVIGVENCNQLSMNMEDIKKASNLPELTIRIPDRILMPSNWQIR